MQMSLAHADEASSLTFMTSLKEVRTIIIILLSQNNQVCSDLIKNFILHHAGSER